MDKKNLIIGILVFLLIISLWLMFQNRERVQATAEIIPTSESLRFEYEQSSQHSAMADIAELSCFPTSRFDCDSGSCVASTPATYYFVDYGKESGTYFRCDAKGCDSYPVEAIVSGEFTQFIPLQGQAMMLKVTTGEALGNKGEFLDIATLGTGAVVSSGKCEFRK